MAKIYDSEILRSALNDWRSVFQQPLKARLVEAGIFFPKTHDLEALLDLILPQEPLWEAFRPKLNDLTSFAISFRYPGESATREMAKTAVSDCRAIRRQIKQNLGFSN